MKYIPTLTATLCFALPVSAQILEPYAGQWHMHSTSGYHGSLSMDGAGGCSYFMTTAFMSVQATCVVRQMPSGELMIFGAQEGNAVNAPTYGQQLTLSRTNNAKPMIVVNFIIDDVKLETMSGKMVVGANQKRVTFRR